MRRSLLVNALANNMQSVVQNVLSIAAKQKHWRRTNREYSICWRRGWTCSFVPFIDEINYKQESTDILDNKEFFPTDPHLFCAGTIIKEKDFFLGKERNGQIGLLWFSTSAWMIPTRPSTSLVIVTNTRQLAQEHCPSLLVVVLLTQSPTLITWTIYHSFAQRKMNTGMIGY